MGWRVLNGWLRALHGCAWEAMDIGLVQHRRRAMASELSRQEYAARYGPTTGDRVRLGDTDLLALIERDETSYGDEVLRGWGKTMRTGIMMSDRTPAASELDLLIANVIVIDPVLGIRKTSIGVKDGVIVGGGRTPDILAIAGVGNVIGSSTTPTIPYGRNVVAEHHAMMWSVHGMNPRVPSDRTMIADRIRDSTMRAESVLHELGAISIINSDSQGMGRIGESIR